MRLQRLTGLEQEKIHEEMEEIKKEIACFNRLLKMQQFLSKKLLKSLMKLKEPMAISDVLALKVLIDILN